MRERAEKEKSHTNLELALFELLTYIDEPIKNSDLS